VEEIVDSEVRRPAPEGCGANPADFRLVHRSAHLVGKEPLELTPGRIAGPPPRATSGTGEDPVSRGSCSPQGGRGLWRSSPARSYAPRTREAADHDGRAVASGRPSGAGAGTPAAESTGFSWATLLKRVFAWDVLLGTRCGGRRQILGVYPGGPRLRDLLQCPRSAIMPPVRPRNPSCPLRRPSPGPRPRWSSASCRRSRPAPLVAARSSAHRG
jgi:hypothetical protein